MMRWLLRKWFMLTAPLHHQGGGACELFLHLAAGNRKADT
jgi:hypothetical protein